MVDLESAEVRIGPGNIRIVLKDILRPMMTIMFMKIDAKKLS